MRYFDFVLFTNAGQIKTSASETGVDLREFAYDDPIAAVNAYMYRKSSNGLHFFIYRSEGDISYANFSYDESNYSFRAAYDSILALLKDAFLITKVESTPVEITTMQYFENMMEAKRRAFGVGYGRTISHRMERLYDYFCNRNYNDNGNYDCLCDVSEFIINEADSEKLSIYDERFIKELSNIENHVNTEERAGNTVHYVISARSAEAAGDMARALGSGLLKANRISTRRVCVLSGIDPDLYLRNNYFEDFIADNAGGIVVIDLSVKFGCAKTRYTMASKYIEQMFKQYRNSCLFVFTYNMDDPGFSYYLLPEIKKYALTIALKEGRGSRETAVSYLEKLIGSSGYAEYADQADEFFKLFPGEEFSQTDVITAFEKFEPWCINRNVVKAYDYDVNEEFMLDRDLSGESSYEKLGKLIGLQAIKEQIDTIIASDIVEKERKKRKGKDYTSGTMHMVFGGNPGSAKTTVARLFAGIAKEKGILKSGAFVQCSGMDFDTMDPAYTIRKAFTAAKGGVLFVDEAYSLKSDDAVTALITELEEQRDNVIAIFAGYNDRMRSFMEKNEGLKSRIPNWVNFPDYTADELTEIFKLMVSERGFSVTGEAVDEAHYIFEKARVVENFGNGRYVRNLIDRSIKKQSARLLASQKDTEKISMRDLFLLTAEDVRASESAMMRRLDVEKPAAGSAQKELDEMIGLKSVKETVRKAVLKSKLDKICLDKGIPRERASMHMVFTGNPGTAKTTVARLLAKVMQEEKILSTGNFVEVGRADIIGQYVGQTAPLVKKRFREAQGGVLFIDEAYSLCTDSPNDYGNEAISAIVQEMENHRDDVIVIFAGYPGPMKRFIDRNPGMSSRIAFHVEFEDYSADELCEITKLMLSKKNMSITDAAMVKLRKTYVEVSGQRDYGNGRFVRKVLEQAEMNLAERLLGFDEAEITGERIMTIEECDVPDVKPVMPAAREEKRRIGFSV